MLSRMKKSLLTGLSVMLSASLGCGTCAASDNWHVKVRGGISDPCMRENKKCESVCFNALTEKVNEMPAFCGERKFDASPSQFLGCNKEFQRCADKPLSFFEKWRRINRYENIDSPVFHKGIVLAGALALDFLCVMYGGPLGPIIGLPLAITYIFTFIAE